MNMGVQIQLLEWRENWAPGLSPKAVATRQQLRKQRATETHLQEGSTPGGKLHDVSLGDLWTFRQPLWWGRGQRDWTRALSQGEGRGLHSLRRSCWNNGGLWVLGLGASGADQDLTLNSGYRTSRSRSMPRPWGPGATALAFLSSVPSLAA